MVELPLLLAICACDKRKERAVGNFRLFLQQVASAMNF